MNDNTKATINLSKRLHDVISALDVSASIPIQGKSDEEGLFDLFVVDSELRMKTKKLFTDGHYARSVEEAYKLIDNIVKKRVGKLCDKKSGASLMRSAFSPTKTILCLNDGRGVVDKDEQQGYMDIFAGCMTGIRNPRVHDADIEDEREYSLKLLCLADHLVCRAKSAKIACDLEEKG